jgi:hypothetical protein
MSSILKRNVLPFATLAVFAFAPLASWADGGDGGDYQQPAAHVKHERSTESRPLTCAEAKRAAWFQRDLELSDGDVTPTIALPAQCEPKVFAKADSK